VVLVRRVSGVGGSIAWLTQRDGTGPLFVQCRLGPAPQVRMRVWERGPSGRRGATPIVDCTSQGHSGAVEVGGGPWWSTWKGNAAMAPLVKQALNLPIDVEGLADWLPRNLRPPGL
jgi:tocopherol cyclase